ncbi:MAG: Cof-type HAD-IIB family hydrolase [Coprococcus sp.]|nr:Cof-type HAD-IIB family hydrolase [Coprococcus sp.]
MKKAVFFDIDGTLWDNHMQIPESTIRGIQRLRENGHFAFLCSGRSRASIRSKELFDIGFDGVIAGCGTYVEYQGEIIFEKTIPYADMMEMLDVLREFEMPVFLESRKYLYAAVEEFHGDPYIKYLEEMLGADLKTIDQYSEDSYANKMSAVCQKEKIGPLTKRLGDEWELIFHESPVVEIVPGGFSKATGIQIACEHLGVAHKDTYAFGDSANDREMLSYVQHSVAMGNAAKEIRQNVEFVTSDIHADGIWNGLAHYGLL